ncbi:hypothetical protein Acr_07g0010620 [Actinidia rufa]|uniref:Uncharacterized protein n=1 Tax=Actinidia rufa TaxID=165716 RepID=A0A7J0EXD7_9ERIC|nr:hypothetical protein Acr_07g0010620 [Actinidia rufa]
MDHPSSFMASLSYQGSSFAKFSKGKESVDYESSQFVGKVEERLYNKVWVRNGAVIKRRLDLVALENSGIRNFKIPREENPEFELPNIGMPDLAAISHELLMEWYEWDGERTVSMNLTKASLLWAIGTGKTIDLPRMMFLSFCAAHTASDLRGFVPFMGFLTKLFRRSGIRIPLDLIRNEPEGAIDRSSLSQYKGQRKKRRLEAMAVETDPSIGMAELKEEVTNLRAEMNTRMTKLEEEFSHHTIMLQEIKGMLIRMQASDDEEEEEEDN